jgi:hypothetical protein
MSYLLEIIYTENFWNILFEIFKIFLAFTSGLFSSFLINRIRKNKKMRRIREFYISWINFSLESFNRQVILLSNQIKELSESKPPKLIFNNNQLHKLDSLNNEELFDAFVLSNKGNSKSNSRNLHNLGSHIDFLIISIEEVKQKFLDIRNQKTSWNEKWNKEVVEFHKVVFEYVSINKEYKNQYVDQILKMKKKIDLSKERSIESSRFFLENYVLPIKSIFMNQVTFDSTGLCSKGVELSESINILFLQKDELFLNYKNHVEHYEGQLKYTIKKIQEIVNYFQDQEQN